ncbi:MAG: hypothetical protein AAF203_04915 [Pseudomonadota bacterium]
MSKLLILLVFVFSVFGFVGCSEDATSPVAPLEDTSGQASQAVEHTALFFTGKDGFGRDCNLYLAMNEEEHEEHAEEADADDDDHDHEEHHVQWLVKVDYALHGQQVFDSLGEFYNYDLGSNIYTEAEEGANDKLALVTMLVDEDEEEELDPNNLDDLEQEGHLKQFLRLNFKNVDMDEFTEAAEEVIEDTGLLTSKSTELDKIDSFVGKFAHAGHYDPLSCSNFSLAGTADKVVFDLDVEADDDHDHDHDHDHD